MQATRHFSVKLKTYKRNRQRYWWWWWLQQADKDREKDSLYGTKGVCSHVKPNLQTPHIWIWLSVFIQGVMTLTWCSLGSTDHINPCSEHLVLSPGIWRGTDGLIIFKYAWSASENTGITPAPGNTQHLIISPLPVVLFSHKTDLLDPSAFLGGPSKGHLWYQGGRGGWRGSLFYMIVQYK